MRRVHFIAGLPRSGSTLLAAILRQNPRCHASVSSPVATLFEVLMQQMSAASEFVSQFDDIRRGDILRGVFDGFYRVVDAPLLFDTNRGWTGKTALLSGLFPGSRIVCCVRDVGWILDSVERMVNTNPMQLSRIFGYKSNSSVYARAELLMNSDKGLIGRAWSQLREAWFGEFASRLIAVPYDSLVALPSQTLNALYDALGEPRFEHDFEHVVYDSPDYDADLGMPGLHRVRAVVKKEERVPSIPPDLFTRYSDSNFWARVDLNSRKVTVL